MTSRYDRTSDHGARSSALAHDGLGAARRGGGDATEGPSGVRMLMAAGGNLAMVQLRESGPPTSDAVHAAAARGIAGAGGALPHGEAIQRSFGSHDVRGIQAHVGGPAGEATAAMGAEAYATGSHVAFGGAPSLHTAAHEAAHVIQQRTGVSLAGGVGQVGDPYERHADAVADAVAAGRSAQGLLDETAGGGGGGGVQRQASPGGGAEADALGPYAELLAEGVSPDELASFLRSIDAAPSAAPATREAAPVQGQRMTGPGRGSSEPTVASAAVEPVQRSGGDASRGAPQATQITIPGVVTVRGWQARALVLALRTTGLSMSGAVLGAAIDLANGYNVTVGIGPSLGGGAGAGAAIAGTLSAGVVVAPGGVLGLYGGSSIQVGVIGRLALTGQTTIVGGGVERFAGDALAVGVSAAYGIAVGGAALFTLGGEFLGVSVEAGVGAGYAIYGELSGVATLGGRATGTERQVGG